MEQIKLMFLLDTMYLVVLLVSEYLFKSDVYHYFSTMIKLYSSLVVEWKLEFKRCGQIRKKPTNCNC